MKKRIILYVSLILILVSCSPREQDEDIVQHPDDDLEQEISIIPGYQLSTENYKIILPYEPSEARGVIVNQIANRLDINEIEEGLRRHSMPVFDPDDHYFREGQYLSRNTVFNWLGRELTPEQLERDVASEIDRLVKAKMTVNESRIRTELQLGLNPPLEDTDDLKKDEHIAAERANPRYISHILEQNYITRNDDLTEQLSGVSIAIALKSVYRFQTEIGGPSYYEEIPEEDMLREGKAAAQTVLERIRGIEALTEVPVLITLYREEQQEHPVPGNFIAKTVIPPHDMMLGDWETIHEKHVLFPSTEARQEHTTENDLFETFSDEIATFFPNYVGVIGEGFYIGDDLVKMTMRIPMEFQGSGEIIGFTQYMYGLVIDIFENNTFDLEIIVEAGNRVESIISRERDETEPTVHILH